eukprot:scaffold604_cov384-Prasinococcus_capsulatus_cf.AAC.11
MFGSGDPDEVYLRFLSQRKAVLESMSPETARLMLRKLLPSPPRSQYAALIMKPQLPLQVRLIQAAQAALERTEGQALLALGAAAAVIGCAWLVRGYMRARAA